MAIKRREVSGDDYLQAPANIPKGFIANDKAVIPYLPLGVRREAGFALHAGADPKSMVFDDLVALVRTPDNDANLDKAYRNRLKGRLSAIRAFCVLDLGSAKRVRSCPNVSCPLWAFRMGSNPFRRRK